MSAINEAVATLNRCLASDEAIGAAFDLAGGDSAPAWAHVYRDQIQAISDASEALETLIARGQT